MRALRGAKSTRTTLSFALGVVVSLLTRPTDQPGHAVQIHRARSKPIGPVLTDAPRFAYTRHVERPSTMLTSERQLFSISDSRAMYTSLPISQTFSPM